MHITSVKINNIKKIESAQMSFDAKGNLVLVTGKNEQGKSSFLDAVCLAFEGSGKKDAINKLRHGQDKGSVEVVFDEYLIKKTITKNGVSLTVKKSDGSKIGSPQKFLDDVIGNLSFDPHKFSQLESKQRRLELMKISGLDFEEIDQKIATAEENRRQAKRDLEAAEQVLTGFSAVSEVAEPTRTADAIKADYQSIEIAKKYRENISSIESDIQKNDSAIKELEEKIKQFKAENTRLLAANEKIKADLVSIPEIDKEALDAENDALKLYESNKTLFEKKAEAETKVSEMEKAVEFSINRAKAFTTHKGNMIANAEFPIEGLAISDDDILFNGSVWDEICTSKRIRIAFAIAIAVNPKLKFIRISEGNDIDEDGILELKRIAEANGFMIFVERIEGCDANDQIQISEGQAEFVAAE